MAMSADNIEPRRAKVGAELNAAPEAPEALALSRDEWKRLYRNADAHREQLLDDWAAEKNRADNAEARVAELTAALRECAEEFAFATALAAADETEND